MWQLNVPHEGVKVFDSPEAREINLARLEHLESCNLPLEKKRVLDVGCGIGHLAQFFVLKDCEIVCLDGRPENVEKLRRYSPEIRTEVIDVETGSFSELGTFDIVFCYGLLYHLENPLHVLKRLAEVCKEMILIETMVTDSKLPLTILVRESPDLNQSLSGIGNRPSPSYVLTGLEAAGYPFLYVPKTPPSHPDFTYTWKNNLQYTRNRHNLRAVFIGSRVPFSNPRLRQVAAR